MIIKNVLKFLFLLSILLNIAFSSYYEPNETIKPYLDDVTQKFTKIDSYVRIWDNDIPQSYFSDIARDFSFLKDKLPNRRPKYWVVYENCELISKKLSSWVTSSKLDVFYSQCFWAWKNISREIFRYETVKAVIKASPQSWNAPLVVTLSARNSIDPSADTIPKNNYFWYYKDTNWHSKYIWQWPEIKHTFTEPNNYIVHLTVKSVNANKYWILDWEKTININVAPPIANISLYINWKRANSDLYTKVSDEEWKRWVLFDASGTTPRWETKIVESTWLIKKSNKIIYKDTIPDYPRSIRVKLLENWMYFITLKVKDNTGKSVTKVYKLIVSNPVAIINVNPKSWNTSTSFFIDGIASYSIKWKITKYKWTIVWPNWNEIDRFEWKDSFKKNFLVPWYYSVKLEVEDVNWNKNTDEYKFYVESTAPVANFIYDKFDNWEKPSTFIVDASYSYDVDTPNWDSLTYIWQVNNKQNVKIQEINNWKKIIIQFNKKWTYKLKLIVKDKYWKINEIEKKIEVKSSLRPEVNINPNYTVLWEPISIKLKTNKAVAYYEYNFGDWKEIKTQQSFIEHLYKNAWVFNLTVKAYSVDGDSNTIVKKIFIWQKGYPLAVYKLFKQNNSREEQLKSTTCVVDNWKKKKIVGAYAIDRWEQFVIDSRDSINWQWNHNLLKIYYQKDSEHEYINKDIVTLKFHELWCRKVTVFVRDINTNKIDKKNIYFKVVNAKPVIKDVKMYFPQYSGKQSGTFQPRIWTNNVPKDIFTTGFDPLLVKIVAVGAHDKDSSILSYYRWYYYKKWDRENPIKVKITPYNVPEVIFPVARMAGEYIFWVDVCDVDDGCTNSEEYLHLKPVINIPKNAENPNYPQINSVRIDVWNNKWASEVNVWETIKVVVNSALPSKKSDFTSTRVFKYDFDNDWKWDLTTKSPKVEYVYKKIPAINPNRVKVIVIYRWNASNNWYSDYFMIKKWIKAFVDINNSWKDLIFYDMSLWDIKEKTFCFDIKKCKKKGSKYYIKKEDYWYISYASEWKKLLLFKVKDDYWNTSSQKNKIIVKDDDNYNKLLTLPKQIDKGESYEVNLAGSYTDTFIFYYKSKSDNCFIDKDILTDSDWDWNLKNDKDLLCNRPYKLTYNKKLKVVLLINDDGKEKKVNVEFSNLQFEIPEEYKEYYNDILNIVDKYASSDDETMKWLVLYLSSLLENMDDRLERDSLLVSINWWLDDNPWVLEEDDELKLKDIVNKMSDRAVKAVDNTTSYDTLKTDLEIYLDGIEGNSKILKTLSELENTSDKQKRKEILQSVYKEVWTFKDKWIITNEQFEDIKKDICLVLDDYGILSSVCGKWDKLTDVPVQEGNGTTLSKILKVVWRFAFVMVVIFIIIIIIFVIKAKQRREQDEEEEE